MQVEENMKAINVIPMLTPTIMEKIEAVVQSKPKRPEAYRRVWTLSFAVYSLITDDGAIS